MKRLVFCFDGSGGHSGKAGSGRGSCAFRGRFPGLPVKAFTRNDFRQYVKFLAEDISGSQATDEAKRTKTTRVQFLYNGNPYGVVFIDEGMPQWTTDDHNACGKVHLIYQSHVVLGLDVSQNLSKEHATWRWNNVFAFIPGTWMKELIEMAAHIEGSQAQYFEDFTANDALERARQIKL
jgi:hypothetical protein